MKAAALKPHERKKERYSLKAFLWGAVIAAVFIVPSMIIDKGMFLYYGDYNAQVIPFYQVMSAAIKNGEFGWNWYTDLGTSFIGGYSYYNLGSPFFWLMVLFPVKAIPYLMGPITILKFGLSSLTSFHFLKRYTKDKNNAVIGSMLYAFSGFAIYGLVFHFIDVLVFFPLLLVTLDQYIYENKRGRFALMVALCAVVNYYFFAAEAVFCLIYWIVRMAVKSYRMPAKDSVYLILEALFGTGMGTFLLLPSAYHMVGNSRVSTEGLTGWQYWVYDNAAAYAQLIISFFLPPEMANLNVYVTEYASEWSSITAYLPLFGMAGVFAVLLNKRRIKWMRVFYGVCAVFMFVPVLNSSFQLFTDAKYVRWFFMLLLIMSLSSVTALEDPSTKWKKAIGLNLAAIITIALIVGVTPKSTFDGEVNHVQIGLAGVTSKFWIYIAVAVFNLALCAMAVGLYRKNRTLFRKFGALITAGAIVVTMSSTFIFSKISGEKDIDIVGMNMLNKGDSITIDDIQDWRSDIVTVSNYTPMVYDSDSIESCDYAELESKVQQTVSSITLNPESIYYSDDDNVTMFWQIPGMECFHSTSSGSIMDFYEGIDFVRTTLTNWPVGMYGYRSLFSVKYLFNHEETSMSFEDENGKPLMPGWKHIDNMNGYDVYENEYAVPMGFTYDNYILMSEFNQVPTQYKHLVLLDAVVADLDDMFTYALSGMHQTYASDYKFTQEEYFQHCKDRINSSCYEFTRNKKGFEAKINTQGQENDRYVFFSVPFDRGWKAYVNDESADIMLTDFGFMSVKVPANTDSTIQFTYHTPGILYGCFVSGLCLVMLILYLAAAKIQSAPDEEEQKTEEKKESSDINSENSENGENTEVSAEELEEEISFFDIVRETEQQTMMHVYSRVPVVLESGFGSTAYDIEHKKYIDLTSGIGVNALGFANGSWSDAVEKQLREVQHTSNIYYNTTQIQLAEMLCIKTGFSKVFFANSGAEANECAIKLARKYGSDKYGENHTHIVTLENSFHGRTITTLAATGQDSFHKYFMPFTEGFSYAKANDMDSVKSKVTEDTCAVMIELIQGEGGVNPLDREFVTSLAAFCQERDILLIVDEVQTGIGRTGTLYCYENYGISPDIITSAKALAGGLPLSACLCSEKLQDVMTAGTNGTTFGGNPVACAGALKIIDIVSDEDFLAEVREKGEYIKKRLESIKGIKEVRGLGMMIGIVLEKNNANEIQLKCAENGLLVLTAKKLLRLLPPLNIEYEDIDEALDILESTIAEDLNDEKEE